MTNQPDDKTLLLTTALNRIDTLDELIKNQQEQIDELAKAMESTVTAVQALVNEAKAVQGRVNNTESFVETIIEALVTVMGKPNDQALRPSEPRSTTDPSRTG